MRFNESSFAHRAAGTPWQTLLPRIRCEPAPFARSRWASGADPAQQARERDGRPGPVKLSRLRRVAQARLDAARESPCCGVARLPPSFLPIARCEPHQSENSTRGRPGDDAHRGHDEGAIKQVCYSLHAIGAEVSFVDSWPLCRYRSPHSRGQHLEISSPEPALSHD